MVCKICTFVLMLITHEIQAMTNDANICKRPTVLESRLEDDVPVAAPFYVVAMTRTPQTEEIDNICYTYFEDPVMFLHIISTVYKNGSSSQFILHKSDLEGQLGVGIGKGHDCTYHDVTLLPACDESVFPIYRCFISGACSQLDLGPVAGVDTRLMITADPKLSEECKTELMEGEVDCKLEPSEVLLLPLSKPFQCVTSYNVQVHSINSDKAINSISLP